MLNDLDRLQTMHPQDRGVGITFQVAARGGTTARIWAIIARRTPSEAASLRNHDEQFFDSFVLVIGILVGITVGVFFLTRYISDHTQAVFVKEDPRIIAAIDERTRPLGRVVLMGDEELSAAPAIAEAPAPAAAPMTGPQVYNSACTICHGTGVGGAPVTGDVAAWAPRLEQGMEVLIRHSIEGFTGDAGFMPPKGGRVDLSDEEVIGATEYMIEQSR